MIKTLSILIILPFILAACSFKVSTEQNIINDNIQSFAKKREFNDDKIRKYKVNEAIICPIFRNREEDLYSLNISAYSKNPKLISMTIISYKLVIGNKESDDSISEQIKEKVVFKSNRDKTYWGSDVFFATKKVFEDNHIKLNKNTKIELIIEVKVESDMKEETKKLKYDFKYEEDKYLIDLSQ